MHALIIRFIGVAPVLILRASCTFSLAKCISNHGFLLACFRLSLMVCFIVLLFSLLHLGADFFRTQRMPPEILLLFLGQALRLVSLEVGLSFLYLLLFCSFGFGISLVVVVIQSIPFILLVLHDSRLIALVPILLSPPQIFFELFNSFFQILLSSISRGSFHITGCRLPCDLRVLLILLQIFIHLFLAWFTATWI